MTPDILISYLWHGLVGWVGITGVILVVAIYLFVTVPDAFIRHICVAVAIVCLGILFLYPKAFLDGVAHDKARIAVQEQKLRQAGETARADAVRDAAAGVRDPWDTDN